MPRITLNIKSQNRTSSLLTVQELKNNFLTGIEIKTKIEEFPESVYEYWIDYSIKEFERFLGVKLALQVISENKNFSASDFTNFGYIRASYPVVTPLGMDGFYGTIKQVAYLKEWLSVRRTSDGETFSRHINVMPNSGQGVQLTGLFGNLGMIGRGSNTPNYWTLRYVTGFPTLPKDILAGIGMLAALNVLTIANESLAAAMGYLGTSSKSVSIDGLSTSYTPYANSSAGIFGARIKQYSDLLTNPENGLLKRLQEYYGAIMWTTA